MKLTIPKIVGTWCGDFECWPKNHPGCDRRDEQGCDGCPSAERKVILEGTEPPIDVTEDPVQ